MIKRKLTEKSLERLVSMIDNRSIVQHFKGDKPNLEFGYSTDDAARAIQMLIRFFKNNYKKCKKPFETLFRFIKKAERDDGLFNNIMDKEGKWRNEDSSQLLDVLGRTMWALAEISGSEHPLAKDARKIFYEHLPVIEKPIIKENHPHGLTFSILSVSEMLKNEKRKGKLPIGLIEINYNLAQRLLDMYNGNKSGDWKWPSDEITYCCGRIPQAMLVAGETLEIPSFIKDGKECLDFLIDISFEEDTFWPIGNKGWFKRGGERARYDQQPIEAGTAAAACQTAYRVTRDQKYIDYRTRAINWFIGNNSRDIWVINNNGAVYDAVIDGKDKVNKNCGAESQLSFLIAISSLHHQD